MQPEALQLAEILLAKLEDQQAAATRTEESLREQREELGRIAAEVRQAFHNPDAEPDAELEYLREDNRRLRVLLDEYEARDRNTRNGLPPHECERCGQLQGQVASLNRRLEEKVGELEKLREQRGGDRKIKDDDDIAAYEAELNQFRRQLESDRQTLNEEIARLRARNAELNDAAREAELELSRERAQLARERAQLDRMREEIRQELERGQRDAEVHERLAGIRRAKEELRDAQAGPESATATRDAGNGNRWRSFLGRLGDGRQD